MLVIFTKGKTTILLLWDHRKLFLCQILVPNIEILELKLDFIIKLISKSSNHLDPCKTGMGMQNEDDQIFKYGNLYGVE